MGKLIDINTLNKNNNYINNNINARLINNACKNLLPITLEELKSLQGFMGTWNNNVYTFVNQSLTVTVNVNSSGYVENVVLNGTPNPNETCFFVLHDFLNIENFKGDILSSGVNDDTFDTHFLQIESTLSAGLLNLGDTFYSEHNRILINSQDDNYTGAAHLMIVIRSGVIYSNLTYYPMIRRAEITDSTFEPYYRTNKQLDTDLTEINTLLTNNACKNIAPPFDEVVGGVVSSGTATSQKIYVTNKIVTISLDIARIDGIPISNNDLWAFRKISQYDINNNFISNIILSETDGIITLPSGQTRFSTTIELDSNTEYITIYFSNFNSDINYNTRKYNLQVEYGRVATPYKPYYKTNKQLDNDLTVANTLLIDNIGKNLFDYDKWVGATIWNGTGIYENYGITLTANNDDCYTAYRADNSLNIPVQANKKYILSWDCTSENSDLTEDEVFVFFNGGNDNNIRVYAINKQLQFTVPENITFVTIRFGVQNNGNTVSYSNIMLRRAEITDNTFEPYYRTQKQLDSDLTDIENYIGYTDDDIYGLEVDYENNIFTRLAGAVGKTGGSDFNNTNAWGNRKRCNLTDNGIVTAYYGDTAYTETGALTQSVTVNGTEYLVGTSVQVMVEQPKFYYKVIPLKLEKYTTQNGDIGYHIRKAAYYIADTPKNGFKLHPAFIRNGAEKEKIYLSAYEGSLYDVSATSYISDDSQVADFNADKMSSIANAKPMSGLTQNLTRANARKLAHNRGVGWEQMYIHTASATQLLFIIEYGTLNSQQAIGNGVVNTSEYRNTGGTSSLGNTSGSVANNEISYRGEENIWANIFKWEDGINIQNPNPFNNDGYGNVYVADNNFSDNINTLPYEDTNIYPCKTAGGYISAFGYNEKFDWLFIPTEVTGNSSLSVGDVLWNLEADWRIALSLSGTDLQAGLFTQYLNAVSYDHAAFTGSRLVYIPNANESNRSLIQLDKDLSSMIYRDENGSTVLTSHTIDISDDAYIIIKPEEDTGNLSIIDGDEFAIQHWNNIDFDDINYINMRSDEISIISKSSFELNIGSEGGRISIDSSIQLLDYGGNALKLISRDANESQIYIKCIDNNSGNEHIQSAIELNKKDIHIIANKDTASSNTYGDIYIRTNNMQSEVTLKQYIQGVMNGTY